MVASLLVHHLDLLEVCNRSVLHFIFAEESFRVPSY